MLIQSNQAHAEFAVFTMAVRAEVTAVRLAVVDGKRTYAGRLLIRQLARVKDRQQRPSWYPVAPELFQLRCELETVGKKLCVLQPQTPTMTNLLT